MVYGNYPITVNVPTFFKRVNMCQDVSRRCTWCRDQQADDDDKDPAALVRTPPPVRPRTPEQDPCSS